MNRQKVKAFNVADCCDTLDLLTDAVVRNGITHDGFVHVGDVHMTARTARYLAARLLQASAIINEAEYVPTILEVNDFAAGFLMLSVNRIIRHAKGGNTK